MLEIVAEKTGYPKDMLDPDLDLEADLGIDTVKQAEMFAAIRAAYNIPRDENLKLRNFPTLAHVIKFAQDKSALRARRAKKYTKSINGPGPKPAASALSTPASSTPDPNNAPEERRARSSPASMPPTAFHAACQLPILRPPLNICKPTGVSLERGRRVIIMPDKGGVADALTQRLQAKGVEVLRIEGAPDADALTDLLKKLAGRGSSTRSLLAARARS